MAFAARRYVDFHGTEGKKLPDITMADLSDLRVVIEGRIATLKIHRTKTASINILR